MGRSDRVEVLVALVAALVVGVLASTWLAGTRIGDLQDRAATLERERVEAEANAELLAERVVILTDAANDQRVVLDRLSAACVASGDCVASDE